MQGSARSSRTGRRGVGAVLLGLVAWVATALGAEVARAASDTAGHTVVEQTIVGSGGDFATLGLGPGRPYVVREDAGTPALAGRAERRRSLLYFGQLTDFQLADEESPSRVETLDVPGPTNAAWRPQEALQPFSIDQAIRQMNLLAPASPVAQGDGSRARMAFALTTGDSADNQQRNEVEWVVRLLEGGTLSPNSGVDDAKACPLATDSAANYTGVQDYDDYPGGKGNTQFYDPDTPQGSWEKWPTYTGLMDRAQQSFTAEGLDVPSYVAFGNHDGLAQGNQKAIAAFEAIGVGCEKPLGGALGSPVGLPMQVDADVNRQYVNKAQYKDLHAGAGHQADAHGFAYVDPAEQAASNGAAGYYAWDPAPGFRFIALDTVAEGGIAGTSANGNIDDPQFSWLERELQAASAQDKLIVLYGHHPVRSLTDNTPDETPPACTSADSHGHDANPGCDVDPRLSTPVHLGTDLVDLVSRYPHVIAYVAGHTHENKVTPFARPDGTGWWGIETAAEADWPQQNRLLEVMDNADGTLSIFGTPLDNAAATAIPAPDSKGDQVSAFAPEQLASIGRALAFNDPQAGAGTGEGAPEDNAAELLLRDPRRATGDSGAGAGLGAAAAAACKDNASPRSSVNRGRLRLRTRLVSVSGRALDADGCPSTTARSAAVGRAAAAGRVARVRVYLGRQVRRGCRFLTARGRLSRRRSCRRPLGVLARVRSTRRAGSYTWLLRKRVRLPRGRYFLFTRARDASGNLERPPRRGALVRARLR